MNATNRMFNPTTERGRVYAACVDRNNAESYLLEPDEWQDAECRLIARAFCESSDKFSPMSCVQWICANARRLDAAELFAAVSLTRAAAGWWAELREEHMEAVR